MNRYLDMTFFQCLNFGKLFSVVFIYVKPTRIYQKTLCCNLFQLGYLHMLVLLYYIHGPLKLGYSTGRGKTGKTDAPIENELDIVRN